MELSLGLGVTRRQVLEWVTCDKDIRAGGGDMGEVRFQTPYREAIDR